MIYVSDCLVICKSKLQTETALSTMEAVCILFNVN